MRRFCSATILSLCILFSGCAKRVAPAPTPPPTPFPSPAAPLFYSLLNGAVVPEHSGEHRIIAVMIDNYPLGARPQSGLRAADIIYEVEAEGGITRYMALFLEHTPSQIGPVRSARTYFVDLARPYDPFFAHAGGNDDVWGPLKDLRAAGFADMDEIVGTPEAFWRDSSRYMPHNLYTSVARVRSTAPKYGYPDREYVQPAFAFYEYPPAPGRSPDTIVTFWNHYTVRYHAVGQVYERLINGVVQHDLNDKNPYAVADIIAVWIPAKVLDAIGDLEMNVYGKFPAVLVHDGKALPGRWVAPGPNSLPQLVDLRGAPLALSPGQVYVEVLPQGGTLQSGKNIWSY
jgi:hypothetical protein